MNLTTEQFQRLIDAAMCSIETCSEDECARFATWTAWEYGNITGAQSYCDAHVPPCTEKRGGYCKNGSDGYRLAMELNAMLSDQEPGANKETKG